MKSLITALALMTSLSAVAHDEVRVCVGTYARHTLTLELKADSYRMHLVYRGAFPTEDLLEGEAVVTTVSPTVDTVMLNDIFWSEEDFQGEIVDGKITIGSYNLTCGDWH